MTTKSTHPTRRTAPRRRDMLSSVKREATTPRLAAAAGALAVGAAAFVLWRKAEWRDEATRFGRSLADQAQTFAGRARDRAKALRENGPAATTTAERKPLAAVA